jgi:endoglucanase
MAGYVTDFARSRGVTLPDERSLLSLHYYSPFQFAIFGDPPTWGSPQEIANLQADFARAKADFVDRGIPVILGEFGAPRTTEDASRVFWLEHVAKSAYEFGVAPFLWDGPGEGGELDRLTLDWRTPGILSAFARVASGADYTVTFGAL